jgi:hypothetical protein
MCAASNCVPRVAEIRTLTERADTQPMKRRWTKMVSGVYVRSGQVLTPQLGPEHRVKPVEQRGLGPMLDVWVTRLRGAMRASLQEHLH